MNDGIVGLPIGDELPEAPNLTPGKRVSEASLLAEKALKIPTEIDEDLYLKEISKYSRELIKTAGGINEILHGFHAQDDLSLQDYIVSNTNAKQTLANKLAESVIIVYSYMQEDADIDDDEVEELDPNNMTF